MSSLSVHELPRDRISIDSGPVPANVLEVDDSCWHPIRTCWNVSTVSSTLGNNQPYWLEAEQNSSDNLEVMNCVVSPFQSDGWAAMDVLVKARCGSQRIGPHQRLCCLRPLERDCIDATQDFRIAYIRREQESPVLSAHSTDVPEETVISFDSSSMSRVAAIHMVSHNPFDVTGRLIYDDFTEVQSACGSHPTIALVQYKQASKVDDQARLFPELEKEIAERRAKMDAPIRDQNSKKYKEEICQKVKDLNLCPPEYFDMLCERILKPFSDRFWDEGCNTPSIKGFKAEVHLKPDAHIKFRQPYHLSKFDTVRLAYLYEEAEREGRCEQLSLIHI